MTTNRNVVMVIAMHQQHPRMRTCPGLLWSATHVAEMLAPHLLTDDELEAVWHGPLQG